MDNLFLKAMEDILRPGDRWTRFKHGDIFVRPNIIAVRIDVQGRRWVYRGTNIVTNVGDQFYAQHAALGTDLFVLVGMRLGSNAGTPGAPAKTDVKLQTSTGSTPIAGSAKALDSGYPKNNDDDTDNQDRGVKVVTFRTSYTGGDFNSANIASGDIPDSLTDGSITQSLAVWNFTTKFEKLATDTLKVFVNHPFLGV